MSAVSIRAVLASAIAYFGIVFGAGFVLGVLRVLVVAPRIGEADAELLEIPLMLIIVYCAARLAVGRFRIERVSAALAVGVIALGLLLSLEFTLVLAVRGSTLEAWYAGRDPAAFAAYLFGLAAFALMPAALRVLHARA